MKTGALCAAIRINSRIDFAHWRPRWSNLTEPQRVDLLTNLRYAFPGVRDGEPFVAFVRHMLSAYKGESKRGVRAADSGNDGAPGKPMQESGQAGAMAKDQTL
jgi:hypothetical protein